MEKTRFQALLDQVPDEDRDAMMDDLDEMESMLSARDLLLLFKVAVQGGESPWEPIEFLMWETDEAGKFTNVQRPMSVVVALPEKRLRELTGQAQLFRLGLLELREEPEYGWQMVLTPRGAYAVNWWADVLASDLGFQLPEELATEG